MMLLWQQMRQDAIHNSMRDMMFMITPKATAYIQARGGHVMITMRFEPSAGSC